MLPLWRSAPSISRSLSCRTSPVVSLKCHSPPSVILRAVLGGVKSVSFHSVCDIKLVTQYSARCCMAVQ